MPALQRNTAVEGKDTWSQPPFAELPVPGPAPTEELSSGCRKIEADSGVVVLV
jgi:hypothetical protein